MARMIFVLLGFVIYSYATGIVPEWNENPWGHVFYLIGVAMIATAITWHDELGRKHE